MNLLIKHGEKIATPLIVLGCLVLLAGPGNAGHARVAAELEEAWGVLEGALRGNPVQPDWAFAPQRQVAYVEWVRQSQVRPAEPFSQSAEAFVFYPQPSRPHGGSKLEPSSERALRQEAQAYLKAPEEFLARAEQGRVWISCKLTPELARGFRVVRVEFFKGPSAEAVTERIGERRPGGWGGDGQGVPVEFKERVVWADRHVEPRAVYCYRARVVAEQARDAGLKGVWPEGLERWEERAAGGEVRILYAGPWTPVVSATTPASYSIRFAGILGQLPDGGQVGRAGQPDYCAYCEVRVWVPEMADWQTVYFSVKVGAPLGGPIRWRKKDDSASGVFAFKTDLVLDRIERGGGKTNGSLTLPGEVAVFRSTVGGAEERYSK